MQFGIGPKWFNICLSSWLLAHESIDLSQAETKIIVVYKLKKITFFTQNG
jgi:hypothetical protein